MQPSLFDLDLMVEYFRDPYEFAFYIKQRLENHEGIVSSNEIIHLAYHLHHGLFMPKNSDMVMLDQSLAQTLDADYYHRKMNTPKPKDEDTLFNPWQNKDFNKLINAIKQLNDPSTTDIIFFLMTIPADTVDELMDLIKKTNERTYKDNDRLRSFSTQITNNGKPWGGVTYIASYTGQETIYELQIVPSINKYKAKANMWLTLIINNLNKIQCAIFIDESWKQSEDMDKALDLLHKNNHRK